VLFYLQIGPALQPAGFLADDLQKNANSWGSQPISTKKSSARPQLEDARRSIRQEPDHIRCGRAGNRGCRESGPSGIFHFGEIRHSLRMHEISGVLRMRQEARQRADASLAQFRVEPAPAAIIAIIAIHAASAWLRSCWGSSADCAAIGVKGRR